MSIREFKVKLLTLTLAGIMIIVGTDLIGTPAGKAALYRLQVFLEGPGVNDLIIGSTIMIIGFIVFAGFGFYWFARNIQGDESDKQRRQRSTPPVWQEWLNEQ